MQRIHVFSVNLTNTFFKQIDLKNEYHFGRISVNLLRHNAAWQNAQHQAQMQF